MLENYNEILEIEDVCYFEHWEELGVSDFGRTKNAGV